jgi:Xaa-Pro aminopeptidase
MKTDLDAIMQDNNLDALLITGPGQHNPAMIYLTGGAHLTNADVIKKRGEPPVLFHASMERDEAANTGLALRSYNKYPLKALLEEAGGDRVVAAALRYCKMLTDFGVTEGRVAVYGKVELSNLFPILLEVQRRMPGLTLVGDPEGRVMGTAMLTKDEAEVARIRQMGRVTAQVVGQVAEFLTSKPVDADEILRNPDGSPVTIGQVKGLINLWLAERGVENPAGTIFAIGRDGGVPHSSGAPDDPIRLGTPIVFDIYPCEAGGGVFHDLTRTWCLGYAPPAVQAIYDQVRTVFNTVMRELKPGVHFGEYQKLACEMFEEMGHATILNQPDTEEGYVHGLGHGVGLRIHERPFSSTTSLPEDMLQPGAVVTIEPGLYYPERGYGVRLEDTVYLRPDGTVEVLVEYPHDLVLPMKE